MEAPKNKGGRPKKRSKAGRPTKFTPETINKLEQAFAIDCSVEEACAYAEISRETFYQWLEKNPAFSDRIERLRQMPVLKARQTVNTHLSDPNMAMRYLEKKKRKEFGSDIGQLVPEEGISKITVEIVNAPRKENAGDIPASTK